MRSSTSIADRLFALDVRPVVVASHRRSGTHLTIDLLRKQFPACRIRKKFGRSLSTLYLTFESLYLSGPAHISEQAAIDILSQAPRPVIKVHAILDDIPTIASASAPGRLGEHWMKWIRDRGDFIYVYRDGRDVLSSMQLYMSRFDPSTRVPFAEFIRQSDTYTSRSDEPSLSRPAAWKRHIQRWLDQPRVLSVSYERIINRPEQVLAELGNALGLSPQMTRPLLPVKPTSIWQVRWQRLFARHPQNTAIMGRHKGMKLVKWRQEMTEADRRFFHDQAGDMLIHLGYEPSDAWVSGSA